ncbi:MAG: HD domain-containing phosphohydrolase [Leptospiraceae bacterium]|nr:HD domain-containing phosphohydrolase [Leptospiraceae bacterium]
MNEFDLKECIASFSLAEDLANGNPPETALRASILAYELALSSGMKKELCEECYLTILLRFLGSTSFSSEESELFGGDDIAFKKIFSGIDVLNKTDIFKRTFKLGTGKDRLTAKINILIKGNNNFTNLVKTQCDIASLLATRLNLSENIIQSLTQLHERYDGKGKPNGLAGEKINFLARVSNLSYTFEVLRQNFGTENAIDEIEKRKGKQFDPKLVKVLKDTISRLKDIYNNKNSIWQDALNRSPSIKANDRISIAETFADFIDLKSKFTFEHSRKVSKLASLTGKIAGLSEIQIQNMEIASLIMNIGMVTVSTGIMEKKTALTFPEKNSIELHTYYTEKILQPAKLFNDSLEIALQHHERKDGSGYPSKKKFISIASSIVMISDFVTSLSSERAYRKSFSKSEIEKLVYQEIKEGRFDDRAAKLVLEGMGIKKEKFHRAKDVMGLTSKEIEVIKFLAQGFTNKEIGLQLNLSHRTIQHHTITIYEKLGVNSRAGAVMTAFEKKII